MNTVTDIVIQEIKERCRKYIRKIDYNSVIEEANKELGIWCQTKESEIKTLKRECELINNKIAGLYDDWKNGFLTENDYKRLFENYNNNRKFKENRIVELEHQTVEEGEMIDTTKLINDFIELKDITREHIISLVETIELKERKSVSNKKNGHREPTKKSDIKIHYKISVLENDDLLEEAV